MLYIARSLCEGPHGLSEEAGIAVDLVEFWLIALWVVGSETEVTCPAFVPIDHDHDNVFGRLETTSYRELFVGLAAAANVSPLSVLDI